MDVAVWFSAGAGPSQVVVDRETLALLKSAKIAFPENWNSGGTVANNEFHTAVLISDRLDITEYVHAIYGDIHKHLNIVLVLHNVVDLPGRKLASALSSAGIDVQFIAGDASFLVINPDDNANNRNLLQEILNEYVQDLNLSPERAINLSGISAYEDALGSLRVLTCRLAATIEEVSEEVGLSSGYRLDDKTVSNFTLEEIANEISNLVNPELNEIVKTLSVDRIAQVDASVMLARSGGGNGGDIQLIYSLYTTVWKLLHFIYSMKYHSFRSNKTLQFAMSHWKGGEIRPLPFKPFREYLYFYRSQEFERRHAAKEAKQQRFIRWAYENQIDHFVRIWQVVSLVETIFMILRRERPHEKLRWLDLGCANGLITNMVRLEECLPDRDWEIIGVDWNASEIEIAKKRAGPQRTFILGDVNEAMELVGGRGFNIISAFEFIEHLEDPIRTVSGYVPACRDYFVAGSPLSEPQNWLPTPNHVWTFDREGFARIFREAGMTPTFTNETHLGRYTIGFDWVTVVAGKDKSFPKKVSAL